ncbi:hypothetical protein JMJ77_0012092 [Colletotrichum scovillei]|uniref:Uncharacterized protein n=1 Tax=Colletotrichum scovillei TaxID=1209932 RepID=A0A9P7UDN9_9PEZI|nr:hypothetical protein JMJ77_0012092 [Colletotrichum scovillei]KAG7046381.1 hypothetical protein JMJ78_0011445 [Colletotrichum scovillei]KAG7063730.1 hypothetical protein JMJ76_0006188 [Colletotrichum scovillei]
MERCVLFSCFRVPCFRRISCSLSDGYEE